MNDIFALNPYNGNIVNLTNTPDVNENHPVVSFDGKKIAFNGIDSNGSDIWMMDFDGCQRTKLTNNSDIEDDYPTWSPDGRKIAFVRNEGSGSKIWVMDAINGANQKMISIDDGFHDTQPAWSPCNIIAFSKKLSPGSSLEHWQIYTMNPDGSGQTRITKSNADDSRSDWSPDCSKIAFVRNDYSSPWHDQIFIMDPNGANVENITNNLSDRHMNPKWSPDGTRLAINKATGSSTIWDIYTLKHDGSDLQQITNIPGTTETLGDWTDFLECECIQADFNCDGVVNLADFAIFSKNWLKKAPWR